jgi:transcriptional regulator with XRE-family HTH domain
MREDEHIGARIAQERKLRGLTQQALADRAHVSLSLLRKVEQGSRPASVALVASVAKALRIEHARLTGQPYYSGDRQLDAVHDLIPDLRRELALYGLPPDDEDVRPVLLDDLAARVAGCSELVHAVDYLRLGALLPPLLADLRAAAYRSTGAEHARLMFMLSETYDNAKRLAYDLGYADLGALAVSLQERAAAESEDPLAVAVVRAVRAWTLTGTGAFGAAYRLLVDAIGDLDGQIRSKQSSPETWSVWGFLHLQAALSQARAGDAARTWDHHAAAEHAAAALGADLDHYRLAFGPSNTAIWGVGLAVELMDGPAAVDRAQRVVIPADLPRARAGHHFLDLARGQYYNGDHRGALGSLLTARRIAPQQIRYHPAARETVYALARAERRSSDTLRGLAAWMGIQD